MRGEMAAHSGLGTSRREREDLARRTSRREERGIRAADPAVQGARRPVPDPRAREGPQPGIVEIARICQPSAPGILISPRNPPPEFSVKGKHEDLERIPSDESHPT